MEPAIIRIPANSHAKEAMRLTFDAAQTQVMVIVEKGSSAVIMEEIAGKVGERTHGADVTLEEGASLTYISLERAAEGAEVQIRQRGVVGAGAALLWINATIGGKSVTHDVRTELTGRGAKSDVAWLFYGKAEEHQTLTARNVFAAKDGGGEIVMRGVAEERAQVRCDGMIEIGLGGGGTDTYLTQEVLMLDRTAKVDAVPGLEIKTNDVKASHSASIARVTPEDLFYFASRGIGEREARRMFVEGFLGSIAENIVDEGIREEIAGAIEEKYA